MISSPGVKLVAFFLAVVLMTIATVSHVDLAAYAGGLLIGHIIADILFMFFYRSREGRWPTPMLKLPFEN